MTGNPFLEPEDGTQTVYRRRPSSGERHSEALVPPRHRSSADPEPTIMRPLHVGKEAAGISAAASPLLLTAATPLVLLLANLRGLGRPPDPIDLQRKAIELVQEFDKEARAAEISADTVHAARYALCASIDDSVLATPWGRGSLWVQASLVSKFHSDVISGEGFFRLLDTLKRTPARHLDLLTLLHICLSLGYQGQYRLSTGGSGELEQIREDLFAILQRYRPAPTGSLSPHARAIAAPYRPLRIGLPPWVAALGWLLIVGLAWAGCRLWLAPQSDRLVSAVAAQEPAHMPSLVRARPAAPPPAAIQPPLVGKLGFLQPQIDAGLVAVQTSNEAIRIIIFDLGKGGMFDIGRADIRDSFLPLLNQIGEALDSEPGRITVAGHTDSRQIHTLQFPSNYELSMARAASAGAVIRAHLQDRNRLTTAGYAAQQPRDGNDTEEGRAHNRRIEIVLQRPPSGTP